MSPPLADGFLITREVLGWSFWIREKHRHLSLPFACWFSLSLSETEPTVSSIPLLTLKGHDSYWMFRITVSGSLYSELIRDIKSKLKFFFFAMLWVLQDLSSLTRDWTQAVALKAPNPNHWTTRELPRLIYLLAMLCSMRDLSSPEQGSNLWPLHWKHRVLTTGLPRKSPNGMFWRHVLSASNLAVSTTKEVGLSA